MLLLTILAFQWAGGCAATGSGGCSIAAPGLPAPIACHVGSFGAHLPSEPRTFELAVYGSSEHGCDAAVAAGALAPSAAVARGPHGAGGYSTAHPRGVLVQRGGCSFFDKATAAVLSGAELLVVVDAAPVRAAKGAAPGQAKGGWGGGLGAASPPLVPTIAEWGHGLGGLLSVGVSVGDGRRLRDLAASAVASANDASAGGGGGGGGGRGASPLLLRVALARGPIPPQLPGSDEPVGFAALSQCATRAQALLQGGLVTAAAKAMHDVHRASLSWDSAGGGSDASAIAAAEAPRLLALSRSFLAAGLDAAGGDAACGAAALATLAAESGAAEAVAASSKRFGPWHSASHGACGQALLRQGDAAGAMRAFRAEAAAAAGEAAAAAAKDAAERAAVAGGATAVEAVKYDGSTAAEAAAVSDGEEFRSVVAAARLAALDFAVASLEGSDDEDDGERGCSGDGHCADGADGSSGRGNGGGRSAPRRAHGGTLWAVTSWARTAERFRALPPGQRGRHRTPAAALQSYAGVASPLSSSSSSSSSSSTVSTVGHGDASVWLLFTLVEELATLADKDGLLDGYLPDGDVSNGDTPDDDVLEGRRSRSGAAWVARLEACADGASFAGTSNEVVAAPNATLCCPSPHCDVRGGARGGARCDNRTAAVDGFLARLLDVRVTLALFLDEAGHFHLADRCTSLAAEGGAMRGALRLPFVPLVPRPPRQKKTKKRAVNACPTLFAIATSFFMPCLPPPSPRPWAGCQAPGPRRAPRGPHLSAARRRRPAPSPRRRHAHRRRFPPHHGSPSGRPPQEAARCRRGRGGGSGVVELDRGGCSDGSWALPAVCGPDTGVHGNAGHHDDRLPGPAVPGRCYGRRGRGRS